MTQVQHIARLSEAGQASGKILGGGTILMREVNYNPQTMSHLVRVSDPSLKEIRREGDRTLIGAGVTMAQVIGTPELAPLALVARTIGGPALRNMATVGGNLFAEHPYGDFTVALLALDARVHWASGQIEDLEPFLARRDAATGMVAAVSIPQIRAERFRYKKVSRTKPKGISVLSIAMYSEGYGSRVERPRIAFGAMAKTTRRAKAVEAALDGVTLENSAAVEQACQAAVQGLEPFDDAIATGWYRSQVAPVHLKRLLLEGMH